MSPSPQQARDLQGSTTTPLTLTYRERPVRILEEDVCLTRRRNIKMYKVQWSNHTEHEATWEREDYLQQEFPELLNV
jgi:hypothetical protein